MPNARGPVIVAGTFDVAAAIIAESDPSFLGTGLSSPDIDLGPRAVDARLFDIARTGRVPGAAIFFTVWHQTSSADGGCATRWIRAA